MDEYRAGETNAVVLAGMCTALAVVLSVIGFYMPLISLVVFLLIPLPIAYLGMKEGTSWSIIVTAGIMILDSVFFGFISAAFLCAIFGVLGVILGICYRNKVSAAATLAAGAVVVLAALIGQAFAAMYILNVPPMIFGGEAMDTMEQQMMAQMEQFYSGELLTQAQENVKQMMDAIRKSIPAATVGTAKTGTHFHAVQYLFFSHNTPPLFSARFRTANIFSKCSSRLHFCQSYFFIKFTIKAKFFQK